MSLVIFVILAIGLYLAVSRPYIFVIYYGLIGSDMGAKGITSAIEIIFPYYSLFFKCLLAISLFVSCVQIYKTKDLYRIKGWYNLSWYYIITMIFALACNLGTLTLSSFFGRIITALCVMGPAVFIIWLAYAPRINHKRFLLYYCIGQCIIAFLIVYKSYLGIPFMEVFNAGLYNDGYYYLDEQNSMVAMPSNFYQAFLGKGEYFIRCAQFHNANGLGFASGTLFFLLLSFIIEDRSLIKKFFYAIGMAIVFLLWCNTGTRGPIIGGILGTLCFSIIKRKDTSSTIMIIFLLSFLLLALSIVFSDSILFSYFFGAGSESSFASRQVLNDNTFAHFFDFIICGNGGDLEKMVIDNIDPHELPLRIFCMYGIIAAIFVALLTIFKPLKLYLSERISLNLFSSICFWISLLVSLTNNLTENVLYWLILGEFVVQSSIRTTSNICGNNIKTGWTSNKKLKRS